MRSTRENQLDGLDIYASGRATINDTVDRYMATKYNLRESTKSNYLYTYNHFVKDDFGRKKLVDIKYSDVLQFYYYLLNERDIALGTLDSIHCLLHPTFQLAVRDDIIRKNPTDGVMKEISKQAGKNRGVRHALTVEQQRAFMEYMATHPVYYPVNGSRKSVLRVALPKTEAGIRTIPMLDVVKDAFELEREEQEETGFNEQVIDGMSGFVFKNRFGDVPNPQTVNHTIKRIVANYNAEEVLKAKRKGGKQFKGYSGSYGAS